MFSFRHELPNIIMSHQMNHTLTAELLISKYFHALSVFTQSIKTAEGCANKENTQYKGHNVLFALREKT